MITKDTNKEKLYEAFGELLYMVAMADGIIQADELQKIDEILASHPWAREIKWSFSYEIKKKHNADFLYRKVIDTFEQYGTGEEFTYFMQAVEQLAAASDGIDQQEEKVIASVAHEISTRLKVDLQNLQLGI